MKKAFTLIELLVVIAILGIVTALCLPVIKQVKDKYKAVNQVVLEKGAEPALLTPTVNANTQALLDYKWEYMFMEDYTFFYKFTVGSNTVVYANHGGNISMIRLEK